jgi:large subunit ribosomal protein L23
MSFLDRFSKKHEKAPTAPVAEKAVVEEKKATTKFVTPAASAKAGQNTKDAYRVLLNPIVSEKAARGAESKQYTFAISMDATRIGVARAISALYGVRPANVNIVRVKGKRVRFGRIEGKQKDWKKAVITLRAGDQLPVFEGV